MAKFLKDKETGSKGESLFIELLEGLGFKPERNSSKVNAEAAKWDVKINHTDIDYFFECKYDVMSAKTRNVAIEYFNPKSNKPSGIAATTSDFWVIIFPDKEIYIASVSMLKKFLETTSPKRIVDVGGDKNSSMHLYEKEIILPLVFIKINDMTEAEFKFLVEYHGKTH